MDFFFLLPVACLATISEYQTLYCDLEKSGNTATLSQPLRILTYLRLERDVRCTF